MKFAIREIDFSLIQKVWAAFLWPERVSAIEATSALTFELAIDPEIQRHQPVHLGAFHEASGKLLGVLSGHETTAGQFRSRGLWVMPEYRKRGVARALMHELETRAAAQRQAKIWTLARRDSFTVYKRFGFQAIRETDEFEFGPHILAYKPLIGGDRSP